MTKLKISDALEKALHFAFQQKTFLPYFIFQLVVFAFLGIPMLNMVSQIIAKNPVAAASAVTSNFGIMIIGIVIAVVLGVIIQGTYIHNYKNKKSLKVSFDFAKKRFWSLLAVLIVTGILTTIISLIPWVGWILSIIVTLGLVFGLQAVIVDKKDCVEALKTSWRIFRKEWLKVLLSIIAMAIVAIIIQGLFVIPLFFVMVSAAISFVDIGSLSALAQHSGLLLLTGLVFLIGTAITKVFQIAFLTEIYMKLKGRR
ncbi:MAG: hypothetical protein J7K31_03390 [Candidatus Aenigmarchaeota archaeon]|nr:hypothetical protein [Candidatus Aenigmarchaeota archaeon]